MRNWFGQQSGSLSDEHEGGGAKGGEEGGREGVVVRWERGEIYGIVMSNEAGERGTDSTIGMQRERGGDTVS